MRRRPGIAGIKATQAERVRRRRSPPLACPPPAAAGARPPHTCPSPAPRAPQPQGQFRAVGEAVAETQAAVMRGQMAEFKERLEEFALRHKADIRGNPEFRWGLLLLYCCTRICVAVAAPKRGSMPRACVLPRFRR